MLAARAAASAVGTRLKRCRVQTPNSRSLQALVDETRRQRSWSESKHHKWSSLHHPPGGVTARVVAVVFVLSSGRMTYWRRRGDSIDFPVLLRGAFFVT